MHLTGPRASAPAVRAFSSTHEREALQQEDRHPVRRAQHIRSGQLDLTRSAAFKAALFLPFSRSGRRPRPLPLPLEANVAGHSSLDAAAPDNYLDGCDDATLAILCAVPARRIHHSAWRSGRLGVVRWSVRQE